MFNAIKRLTFALIILLVLSCIGMIGCGNNNGGSDNGNGATQYCTVTFDSQGGSAVSSQQVLKGDPVNKPGTPTRDGYIFTGWMTDANIEWHFVTDKVNADITLFAGWRLIEADEEITKMYITIDGNKLEVKLADNSAVAKLVELLKQGDIVYYADDYGNFEKVGSFGHTLPTSNTSITTEPGDVILYSGNQIVLFYGSNTWSYTRLGKIDGYTTAQLRTLLGAGKGRVKVTVSIY